MPEAVHIPWQPIGGGRASEAIYDQLRELITSGVLKPGDRLPSERAMMEQLHRSRPTIREALRMLEQGGYVASTHGASGAVVQELTIDGVEQPLSAMLQLNQISLEELASTAPSTTAPSPAGRPGAAPTRIWRRWTAVSRRRSRPWAITAASPSWTSVFTACSPAPPATRWP